MQATKGTAILLTGILLAGLCLGCQSQQESSTAQLESQTAETQAEESQVESSPWGQKEEFSIGEKQGDFQSEWETFVSSLQLQLDALQAPQREDGGELSEFEQVIWQGIKKQIRDAMEEMKSREYLEQFVSKYGNDKEKLKVELERRLEKLQEEMNNLGKQNVLDQSESK